MSDALPGAVTRARLQLMLLHPFLAAATARYPLVDAKDHPWCDTMATDGYHIYVNAEFCVGLTEAELIGVFAHEVMHCVLGHIDRRGERERHLWNVAIDYATNLFLTGFGFQLPQGGLLDRRFHGKTAEDIYLELVSIEKERGSGIGRDGGSGLTGAGGGKSTPGREKLRGSESGDLHLDPADTEGQAQRQADFPTAIERRRIRVSLAADLIGQLPGREAGLLSEDIRKANTTHISWESILSRFFSGLRWNDYRMFPPNKKHAWRGIFLPSIGAPGPEHIVAAIDTSGSMNATTLGKVLAELDRLRSITQCRMTVLECDATIQESHTYEPWELSEINFEVRKIKGRGGTDLKPPVQWVSDHLLQRGQPPDALIYLTDGYGAMPEKAPPYSLLWVVPPGGRDEFPFGEILRLPS